MSLNRSWETDKGYLEYVLENSERAFDELQKLNIELRQGMRLDSNADVGRIGNLHRIVQDYLIVRVAGMFDKNSEVISFERWFKDDATYQSIHRNQIIVDLVKLRNNFVAHNNHRNVEGDAFPETQQILNSNVKSLLLRLRELLNSSKSFTGQSLV